MFDEVERVKERRRERVEQIRLRTRDSLPPYYNEIHDPIDDPYPSARIQTAAYRENTPPSTFQPQQILSLQVFFSVLLVGFAYLLFQSQMPFPSSWRTTGQEVMNRDFNFEAVAVWYESRFGQIPTVLPVLTPHKGSVPAATSTQIPAWTIPKDWTIVKKYAPASSRIVVDVGETGHVLNQETGIVTFVGEKSGYNQTVVVQLAGGREVWYGNLEASQVQVNDYLKKGELIGTAKKFSPTSRYLYVAMKKKDVFIDPMEVISID